MRTITIDGHTFCPDALNFGWVIDAGCRGWAFSDKAKLNTVWTTFNRIYALDIENFSKPYYVEIFKNAALTTHSGTTEAYFFGNGTGNFIKGINQQPGNSPDRPCETKTVPCITLQDIYKEIGTDIDLLKMDIEGAEYDVMMNMEPIPKQISVETHQHCHAHLHNEYWPLIMERLCKHYHLHLFNCEPRYQFLDCLFIRKDLL